MKRLLLPAICAVLLLPFFFNPNLYAQSGRICGVVHTRDGKAFEGPIRWDRNEAFWDDILDATKKREGRHWEGRRREKHISIFGLRISWDEESTEIEASTGIQFGYIKTLERRSGNKAILELKNGERITFYGYSTDVGSGVREILIDDPQEGEVELSWDDLDLIEFAECDPEQISKPQKRLYGEVETRRGDKFKGFITWDMDELFYSDILDGEQRHRTRKTPFNKIKTIERRSSSSAWVTLRNGDRIRLSGTNDVDSGNRGIVVKDTDFGRVIVEWDDFDQLKLLDGGEKYLVEYDELDEIRPLYGMVYDEDGDSYQGFIRWDDDETYTWERLDGEYRGLEVDVEFSQIAQIEKISSRSCRVTTRNGNSFKLSGSNDVNDENKGIYVITEEGDEIELDWYDFDKVIFKHK
ncbi:MAG: hypothetical protein AMJ91_04210 [candidate division Zixibacteria bacterium SM23_73_3]|nr:MAG: hypothetical protein AMJ91_04210 [candidate division Zixibacteria bacterium SM23_73_3]